MKRHSGINTYVEILIWMCFYKMIISAMSHHIRSLFHLACSLWLWLQQMLSKENMGFLPISSCRTFSLFVSWYLQTLDSGTADIYSPFYYFVNILSVKVCSSFMKSTDIVCLYNLSPYLLSGNSAHRRMDGMRCRFTKPSCRDCLHNFMG